MMFCYLNYTLETNTSLEPYTVSNVKFDLQDINPNVGL